MRNSSPAVIAGYSASSKRYWWCWRFLKPGQTYLYLSHTYVQIYARICANDIVFGEYRYVHTAARSILSCEGKRINDASVRWKQTGTVYSGFVWSWKISRLILSRNPQSGELRPLCYRSAVHGLIDSVEEIKAIYRNKLTLTVSKFSMRKVETLQGIGEISRFRNIVRVSPAKSSRELFGRFISSSKYYPTSVQVRRKCTSQSFFKLSRSGFLESFLFSFSFASCFFFVNNIFMKILWYWELYLFVKSLMRRNDIWRMYDTGS